MLKNLSKFTKLKELKWLGLGIILGGLVAGFSVKSYYAGKSFQEVAINEFDQECMNQCLIDCNLGDKEVCQKHCDLGCYKAGTQICYPNSRCNVGGGGSWCNEAYYNKATPVQGFCDDGHFYICECTKETEPPPPPTPSPPPATRPSFQVLKFNDLDGDGVKDVGEDSTGLSWAFRYKIGTTGSWKTIPLDTDPDTGLTKIINVDKGDQVIVQEITNKKGWTVTSKNRQVRILNGSTTYVFEFGNQKIN